MSEELTEMSCPYPPDLCDAAASFTLTEFEVDNSVTGLVTCLAGHRWRVTRLANGSDDE